MSNKKQVSLTPEAFRVNENGEVVINNEQLSEVLKNSGDDINVGEQGIKVGVTVSF